DGAAVSLAQGVEQLAQGGPRQADEVAGIKGAVEVGLVESELSQVEQRGTGALLAERGEVGGEVGQVAAGGDEAGGAGLAVGLGLPGAGAAQLEALEEVAPGRVDRLRVVAPAPVGVLDGVQVPARRHLDMTHDTKPPRGRSHRPVSFKAGARTGTSARA